MRHLPVLILVLICGCGSRTGNSTSVPVESQYTNPFRGTKLYVDPHSQAMAQARSSRNKGVASMLLWRIAEQPQADWLGEWTPNIEMTARQYTVNSRHHRELRVMVAYNVPNRDCGRYSMGGVEGPEQYQEWISTLAKGIGPRPAVIILEPDALADLTTCLNPKDQQARLDMIKFAVTTLKKKRRTAVYIDAGHPNWNDANTMATRLKKAGIQQANGFALNVSNYVSTDKNIRYGKAISTALGGRVPFVIDTSRNGLGEPPDQEWCNPQGRGLGHRPTTRTGDPLVHALLWIKRPGESDGACNGGPAAGSWYLERALALAENGRLD